MTIENDVEQYLVDQIRQLGGLCWKFTSPGNAGVPDRIVLYNGLTVFVEVKAPGKKLRKLQEVRVDEIRKQKVRAGYVDTKEAVDRLVSILQRGW